MCREFQLRRTNRPVEDAFEVVGNGHIAHGAGGLAAPRSLSLVEVDAEDFVITKGASRRDERLAWVALGLHVPRRKTDPARDSRALVQYAR